MRTYPVQSEAENVDNNYGPSYRPNSYVSLNKFYRDRLNAKELLLGCVKRAPLARGDQEVGITQPKDHSLADPCTGFI